MLPGQRSIFERHGQARAAYVWTCRSAHQRACLCGSEARDRELPGAVSKDNLGRPVIAGFSKRSTDAAVTDSETHARVPATTARWPDTNGSASNSPLAKSIARVLGKPGTTYRPACVPCVASAPLSVSTSGLSPLWLAAKQECGLRGHRAPPRHCRGTIGIVRNDNGSCSGRRSDAFHKSLPASWPEAGRRSRQTRDRDAAATVTSRNGANVAVQALERQREDGDLVARATPRRAHPGDGLGDRERVVADDGEEVLADELYRFGVPAARSACPAGMSVPPWRTCHSPARARPMCEVCRMSASPTLPRPGTTGVMPRFRKAAY